MYISHFLTDVCLSLGQTLTTGHKETDLTRPHDEAILVQARDAFWFTTPRLSFIHLLSLYTDGHWSCVIIQTKVVLVICKVNKCIAINNQAIASSLLLLYIECTHTQMCVYRVSMHCIMYSSATSAHLTLSVWSLRLS